MNGKFAISADVLIQTLQIWVIFTLLKGSDPQFQVGKNLNSTAQRSKGYHRYSESIL